MTQPEREFINRHLVGGRDALFAAIAGVSPAQSCFRTGTDRWSIGDCVEHVAITEDVLFDLIMRGAENPAGVALSPDKDARLAAVIVDRSRKFPAPEAVRPAGRFASVADAAEHFRASRERSLAFARECADDLRCRFTIHPLLAEIECWRCLVLLALHPARHAAQIEEIKQHAAFPKD